MRIQSDIQDTNSNYPLGRGVGWKVGEQETEAERRISTPSFSKFLVFESYKCITYYKIKNYKT